jgi:hypothetical protein
MKSRRDEKVMRHAARIQVAAIAHKGRMAVKVSRAGDHSPRLCESLTG